jgi:serine/threonine-protein kinase
VDWEQEARASVARALERAPELAETHLAAGIHATQYGNYPEAVRALSQTLAIAPICAEAHEHLGVLECEAGRWESGARRLKVASELDPAPHPLTLLARTYALHGQDRACDELLTRLEQRGGVTERLAVMMRLRVLAWRGDLATARHILKSKRADEGNPLYAMSKLYVQTLLGEVDEQEAARYYTHMSARISNRRRLTHSAHLITEMLAGRGNLEMASAYLTYTASLVLLDLEWLDLCPLLAPLRPLPAFTEARRIVQARVDAITHL